MEQLFIIVGVVIGVVVVKVVQIIVKKSKE